MNQIVKGLFLGGYEDATDSDLLHENNITHILTVHELQLSRKFRNDFQYLFIETKSVWEIDLLSQFSITNDFISTGIKAGGVLVHCQFGMARSATVVIAFIMYSRKCNVQDAFDIVKAKRRVICPTDSFMNQLQLFQHMKWNLDLSYSIYRLYHNYFVIANNLKISELVRENVVTTDDDCYKCANCQFRLFNSNHTSFHLTEEADIDFLLSSYFEIEEQDQESAKHCATNHLYIELMDWINVNGAYKGELTCPGCSDNIGTFDLNGLTCDCGKWVFPSILIHTEKINQ